MLASAFHDRALQYRSAKQVMAVPPPPPPSLDAFPPEACFAAQEVFWSIDRIIAPDKSAVKQVDPTHIQGIPASAGRYTGTVRVVRDETEFGKIRPGGSLVCPTPSSVWSILFPSIGALVTESGGILSHAVHHRQRHQTVAKRSAGHRRRPVGTVSRD